MFAGFIHARVLLSHSKHQRALHTSSWCRSSKSLPNVTLTWWMSHDDPSQACLCLWVEGEQLLRWSWSSYNTNRPHALSAPPAHVSEVFLAVLRPFLFFSCLYLFTDRQFINFINIQSLDSLHTAHVTTTNLNASDWAFIWDQHKAAHNCEVEEKIQSVQIKSVACVCVQTQHFHCRCSLLGCVSSFAQTAT